MGDSTKSSIRGFNLCSPAPLSSAFDPPPPQAIASMKPGDVAIIFTPDDTHYDLSAACIAAGLHVLVAKPIVKTLQEHKGLVELANKQNVLVSREGPSAEGGDAFWGWGHPTSS